MTSDYMKGYNLLKSLLEKKYFFLYGLVLSVGLAIFPVGLLAEPIKYGANESPPYWTKILEGNGMGGEILHAISKVAGLQSEIEFLPLQRLIDDDANNDLGNPVFYMEVQSFAAIIPIAVYRVNFTYYQPHHKEKIIINGLDDLKGYKIGLLQGTLIGRSYFDQAGIVFESSYSQASLIKKIRLGRIDLFLEIELIAKTLINDLYPDEVENFKIIEIVGSSAPIAVMIAEDYPGADEIGEKLRAGLKEIIKNGSYQKIIEKYYGKGGVPINWFDDLEKYQQLYNF